MRTSKMRTPILLLPLVLTAIGSATLEAQDTAARADESGENVFTGNRTVEAGEVVEGIVVVGGDLRVVGEVTENAVVVGGNLILEPTGVIGGDAVVTGGELRNQGGRVGGEMRTIGGPGLDIAREIQRAVGGREAMESSDRERSRVVAVSPPRRAEERRSGFFTPIRRGMAGIISTFAFGLVLAGIGSALVFYGRPYLETVSDTVRGSTVRAGATGLAASFLAIPAFVVLVVAMVVSIIGIPFLLIAIPLYPVALFAAAVYGLLAVAHALGERTAEQSRDGLDLRHRNSYAYLFTGVAMILLPHGAAHLVSMVGFLGFIGTLLKVITWVAIWAAATVGFGAVILSRAGTRRTFATPQPESAYMNDDLFASDPIGVDDV